MLNNRLIKLGYFVVAAFGFFFVESSILEARPEYASELQIECSSCHIRPFGGGQRNSSFGKIYGMRGMSAEEWELVYPVSFDSRSLMGGSIAAGGGQGAGNSVTKALKGDRRGFLMSNVIGTHLATKWLPSLELVLSYDIGMFKPGLRDAYFLYKPNFSSQIIANPYFLLGQSIIPFGLLTDEHRTYTKLISQTTIRDLNLKASLGGELFSSLHFDLGFLSKGSDEINSGFVVNARWLDGSLPFYFGASYMEYQQAVYTGLKVNPKAASLYAALNVDKLISSSLPMTALFEYVRTNDFSSVYVNPYINAFFNTFDNIASEKMVNTDSEAYMVQLKYKIHPRLSAVYRYDAAKVDMAIDGVSKRHGLGLDIGIYKHFNILLKHEKSSDTRLPGEAAKSSYDTTYLVLHSWL